MACDLICQRHNRSEICDAPAVGSECGEVDHATHDGKDDRIHPLEVPDDAVETDSESGGFQFFGCRCPFHVDAESMANERLQQVERKTTEEQDEHRTPFDGLQQAHEEGLLSESMPQHSVGERREDVEDDSHADEDLPGRDVELIDLVHEPTEDKVVGECKRDGGGDGVVCADICDDGDLAGDFDVATQEPAEQRRYGSAPPPVLERVEHELVTAIRVLLPSGEFVVDCEGDTFFEAAVMISRESGSKLAPCQYSVNQESLTERRSR